MLKKFFYLSPITTYSPFQFSQTIYVSMSLLVDAEVCSTADQAIGLARGLVSSGENIILILGLLVDRIIRDDCKG